MIDNRYTKAFIKNDRNIIKRSNVINYLINKNNYKKYLEIGIFDAFTFKDVKCELKHGVDPGAEGHVSDMVTHQMTSDEFFNSTNNLYDVIFIDGLHHYQQVVVDINNALQHVSENGYILLHDCHPCDELAQRVPRQSIVWNGDVWKALILFREANPEAECCVLDTDFGIGVIKKTKDLKPITSTNINLTYDEFKESKVSLLNLVSCESTEELQSLL
tara:strand:- start:655 stop:1305 length:651 start_codon:yes stop_codon:yes gene_type:complete